MGKLRKGQKITFDLLELGGDTLLAVVAGALGRAARTQLLDLVESAARRGAKKLVVDLAGAGIMDGAGLINLFRMGFLAREREVETILCATGPRSLEVLGALGLTALTPAFASRVNALRAVAAKDGAAEKIIAKLDELDPGHEICPPEQWAVCLGRVTRDELPTEAEPLNVVERHIQTPMNGYGKLWLKHYTARLCGAEATPAAIARELPSKLGEFWPEGNDIIFSEQGIVPGAVGAIKLTMPGGLPLATGVRVAHAGSDSFTFATLQGHMASGLIDFSVYQEEGCPVLAVTSLARTGDPLFDVGFRLFGHNEQEKFWRDTLTRGAAHFGVAARVATQKECVSPERPTGGWSNTYGNTMLTTGLAGVAGAVRRLIGAGGHTSSGEGASKTSGPADAAGEEAAKKDVDGK